MPGISACTVKRLAAAASISAILALGAGASAVTGTTGAGNGAGINNAPPGAAPALQAKPGPASGPASGKNAVKSLPATPAKPLWAELNPAQQQALAPLSAEWDKLDSSHKKKWLTIGNKFNTLKPDQQVRVQNRMRDWAKLSPEQRRVARESYSRAKKFDSGEKTTKWQQYQQLPEDQKKKLAADAVAKKRVANLPPASQSKGKLTPPPKTSSRPRPEQIAVQPAANPSVPPVSQPASNQSAPLSPQPAVK
jgi:hypothetical protein